MTGRERWERLSGCVLWRLPQPSAGTWSTWRTWRNRCPRPSWATWPTRINRQHRPTRHSRT